LWLSSTVNEPLLEPYVFQLDLPNNGDIGNREWMAINESGGYFVYNILKENVGNSICITGSDVVFLKPFVEDALSLLREKDVLFQAEYGDGEIYNPDVSFWKVSKKVVAAYARVVECWDTGNGDLFSQIELYNTAMHDLGVGVLPTRYASNTNGGNPVLFHANNTFPDSAEGSVAKKLRLLQSVLGS
jgi:hypothetical protein